MRIVTPNVRRILRWAESELGFRSERLFDPRALGLLGADNTTLVAAAIYHDFNGQNVNCHILSDGSKRWLNRLFLRAMFDYPFGVMGAERLTGYVDASNTAAIRFDEHLGFTREGVLERAAGNGDDIYVYRMFKEDCRFLS